MKKHLIKNIFAASLLVAAIQFSACKSKPKDTTTTDTTVAAADTTIPAATAPVTVAPDDELTKGVKDATEDFPGVTATVANGEVTLTGNTTREQLQRLMMSLNSLHPKKINNNLTISK
jgi:outer membrane receptor for ferrienterochelin and colicin